MIGRVGNYSNQMWLFNRLNELDREQVSIDRQIASGRRDGPISYFISANWMRFDLSGMRVAQDNINDGIGLIDTTQINLLSVADMLQEAHDLAVRGANETLTEDEQGKLRQNIYEILGAADETATRAKFNGKSLFTGEKVNIQIGPKVEDMYYVRLPKFNLNDFGLSPTRPDKSRPTPPNGGHPHLPPSPQPPSPPAPGPHPRPPVPPSGWEPDRPDRPKHPRGPHENHQSYSKPKHNDYKKPNQNVQKMDLSWALNPLGVWDMLSPQAQQGAGTGNQESGSVATYSHSGSAGATSTTTASSSATAPLFGRPTTGGRKPPPPPPPPPPPAGQPGFKEILNRIKDALKTVKSSVIGLDGQKRFLDIRLGILGNLMVNTEAMRSRYEDAEFVALQRQSARNDIYRQAAMQSIAQNHASQREMVAMFLGLT